MPHSPRSRNLRVKKNPSLQGRLVKYLLSFSLMVIGLMCSLYLVSVIATQSFDLRKKAAISPIETIPSSKEIKVLVLQYFPESKTKPGYLDQAIVGPDFATTTIAQIQQKVSAATQEILVALQEGSRYHAYTNPQATAYLRYRLIKNAIQYNEPVPLQTATIPWNNSAHRPNYQAILTRQNICNLVDNQGVDQVWLWSYHYGKVEPAESNMAMGRLSQSAWNHGNYGDISNSEQINDLPVCNHTYTVFNYNFGRGAGEALEDHTHQLESLFNFLQNRDPADVNASGTLFWNKFVGAQTGSNQLSRPACGWTHLPPNSVSTDPDYNWFSTRTVESDCMDWKPDGTGKKTKVNCTTWGGAGCPNDSGKAFKIWWMHSLPGYNNGLTFKGRPMRNWWDMVADPDQILTEGGGLLETKEHVLAQQFYSQFTGAVPLKSDTTYLSTVSLIRQGNCTAAASNVVRTSLGATRKSSYSNAEYVRMLYRALLSRDADAAGLNGWVAELEKGRYTRDTIITAFYSFPEAKTVCTSGKLYTEPTIADHRFTQQYYKELMGAIPPFTDGPYRSSVALIRQNQCQTVALSLLRSPAGIAHTKNLSAPDYVRMLYRALLSRDTDAAGLNGWTAAISKTSTDRTAIATSIFGFPETNTVCKNRTLYTASYKTQ